MGAATDGAISEPVLLVSDAVGDAIKFSKATASKTRNDRRVNVIAIAGSFPRTVNVGLSVHAIEI